MFDHALLDRLGDGSARVNVPSATAASSRSFSAAACSAVLAARISARAWVTLASSRFSLPASALARAAARGSGAEASSGSPPGWRAAPPQLLLSDPQLAGQLAELSAVPKTPAVPAAAGPIGLRGGRTAGGRRRAGRGVGVGRGHARDADARPRAITPAAPATAVFFDAMRTAFLGWTAATLRSGAGSVLRRIGRNLGTRVAGATSSARGRLVRPVLDTDQGGGGDGRER